MGAKEAISTALDEAKSDITAGKYKLARFKLGLVANTLVLVQRGEAIEDAFKKVMADEDIGTGTTDSSGRPVIDVGKKASSTGQANSENPEGEGGFFSKVSVPIFTGLVVSVLSATALYVLFGNPSR
jgi:hypothetical protein